MYNLISYEYTPYMCETIKGNAVISESIPNLIQRNINNRKSRYDEDDFFTIIHWMSITKKEYKALLHNNPRVESYITLKEVDYPKEK